MTLVPGSSKSGSPSKFALIVGNSEYNDPRLSKLRTPTHDTKALADLLADPEYGGFDEVVSLLNRPSYEIWRKIALFFSNRGPDDLLLLYFSGHGIRDEKLELYFGAPDTTRDLLDGSAVRAADVRRVMDASRSLRQVLILDCCHSGAFPAGVKGVKAVAEVAPGASVGTQEIFAPEGYGRVVLTARDSTEYAWEGDVLHGPDELQTSVFTEHLIRGIRTSEADTDYDQMITVDELFAYVSEKIREGRFRQQPKKFGAAEQGRIVISKARQRRGPLPRDIEMALRSVYPGFRLAAASALLDLYREVPQSQVSAYVELFGLTLDPVEKVAGPAVLGLGELAVDLRTKDFARLQELNREVRKAFQGQPDVEKLLVSFEAPIEAPKAEPAIAPPRGPSIAERKTLTPAGPPAPAAPNVFHPAAELTLRRATPDPSSGHPLASGGGLGFVVNIKGQKSHDLIAKGIQVLINLAHRGASGADPETGDGAGILIQIPHRFFATECVKLGFSLPAAGEYGVGMIFLPVEPTARLACEGMIERIVHEEGLVALGWRDTPVDGAAIGRIARATQPYIQQLFVGRRGDMTEDALERRLYVVRKRVEAEILHSSIEDKEYFHVPSLSARTIVYKGLLLAPQIADFYPELRDPATVTALAMVHQSFVASTPSWNAAQPCRHVSMNGSFTSLLGNLNWMYARQSVLASPLFGGDIRKILPDRAARQQRFRGLR